VPDYATTQTGTRPSLNRVHLVPGMEKYFETISLENERERGHSWGNSGELDWSRAYGLGLSIPPISKDA
jgi:hypothetical protein